MEMVTKNVSAGERSERRTTLSDGDGRSHLWASTRNRERSYEMQGFEAFPLVTILPQDLKLFLCDPLLSPYIRLASILLSRCWVLVGRRWWVMRVCRGWVGGCFWWWPLVVGVESEWRAGWQEGVNKIFIAHDARKNDLELLEFISLIIIVSHFHLNLLYDIGFMDWSDLWSALSNWDSLHFD
ncbi:hypothetical protein RJT34_06544 [Clitoria ternatea]|uniref:Uncharacterized protein n=1 Tax=Clitoria ternatea TaxID=43366 RepID=A0AAN9K487_CLITE